MYLREDQFRILVQVSDSGGDLLDVVPWQSYEGGDVEASNTNTRPGNMAPAVELGGPAARTDVTVRRLYSPDILHGMLPKLESAVGRGSFKVSWTPLDADGNPDGATIVQTGILKSVAHPNADANATAAAQLTLTAGMNQVSSLSDNA